MTHTPLKGKKGMFTHQEFYFEAKDVAEAVALHRSREFNGVLGGRCTVCKNHYRNLTREDNKYLCRDCCIKHDFADAIPEGEKQ